MTAPFSLGILRLNDSVPAVLAHETGLFRDAGLDVTLNVEPSWANIADKLLWGRLQAAIVPPPLAIATHTGLRAAARRLLIPMTISLGGNAVAVSTRLAQALGHDESVPAMELGARLKALIAAGDRPRFAVVHAFSTHNLLLRYWLAACGIDLAREIRFSVVPPERCVQALAEGEIDGFCAGAPWGTVAEARGDGRVLLSTHAIWPDHPEKCLAVAADWAEGHPSDLERLMQALLRAALICDDPGQRPAIASLLARPRYLGLNVPVIQAALEQSRFHRHGANLPQAAHAEWLRVQMKRWNYLESDADLSGLYRPDLYRAAAARLGVPEPVRTEGEVLCDGAVV